MGVSVEDQQYGVPRIDYLRQVNATIWSLSVEPLFEALRKPDLADTHWVVVGSDVWPKSTADAGIMS